MLFGHNYFNVRMNGKKVKIDTDKTEFTVTVKNGKATFSVEAEPIVTDECSDYCDYCNLCAGNNYTEHGTPLKAGENNCYLAKIRHGLAYRMKDGCEPLRGMSLVERLNLLNDTPSISLRRVFDDHRDAGK